MNNKIFCITVLLWIVGALLNAQQLSGVVLDKDSREPVPFANISVKGTLQGTTADINGAFSLPAPQQDTLLFSSVGYYPEQKIIREFPDNRLTIYLTQNMQYLDEVTVKPEVERAVVLFKQFQKKKIFNQQQIENTDNYKTLSTTNVYIAVDTASNITGFIDNFKELTISGDDKNIRFTPVYLAENGEIVSGDSTQTVYNKKDGIFPRINQAIETYILRNVVVNLDFYDEYINILNRSFLSPLAENALSRYNLYLNDSSTVNDDKYFHFSFAPKNRLDQLFSGSFTIEDKSFALTSMEVNIPKESNLNFVKGFRGHVLFQKTPEGEWFYREQDVRINMSLAINNETDSLYSSETVVDISSGNWIVNKLTQYALTDDLKSAKNNSWSESPEFAISSTRKADYYRVEKLKEQKLIKGVDALGGLALTGYLNAGKIDIGPMFTIYSTNAIEGHRFTIPLRTSEQLSKHVSVGGFLGMGTRSKELKYGGNIIVQPLESDKYIFRLNYSDDYSLVSHDKFHRFVKNNPNPKGNGNLIAAFTSTEKDPYLKEEKSLELRVEYNVNEQYQLEFSPYYLHSTQTPDINFSRDFATFDTYENYGLLMNLRIVSGQHYDKFYFDRIYYLDPIPVINLSWDIGQTLLPGQKMKNSGWYSHLNGSIKGRINMGQVFMEYMLNGGWLSGEAPYDLLDLPAGSMSLGFAKYQFSLLHHAAFAHNLYTNTHFHFNGGGILLNRVPLIRNLKLREIISFKGHYGTLTDNYKGVFDLPTQYSTGDTVPYAEIGVGLTNILKFLRVEYVHLVGTHYLHSDFTDKHGIRIRAEMSF
ncbi:DUF5686 and carboxypeptidase-like regulatory domain-containing protein [Marinilabilia sp.]|uniref:DUF5686 and carboxypeptidase-like regulatory domain-containing protein n=1 Tax=Marinilabilia sp. TaxID=2021252 RepID=UPI0025C10272|nr:DUF5686 and carboxypeptidase-like regulatory domain-containing protein [Marinilabilia sp.]